MNDYDAKASFEHRLRAHFAWLQWLNRKGRQPDPDPCWICDRPAPYARVYTTAWEPAVWVPACQAHATPLILAA